MKILMKKKKTKTLKNLNKILKDLLIDFHPQMKQISHKEMLTFVKLLEIKEEIL